MRACVFVDGENFRHSIGDLFVNDFRTDEYLPKEADWTGLFDWVVGEVAKDCFRMRTYWYVIQSVDYTPYNLSKLLQNPGQACTVLSRFQSTRARIDGSGDRLSEGTTIVNELQRHQVAMDNRFNGWTNLQNGIAQKHDGVEFRRAGAILYNLVDRSFGQEKAVDVKLATDMIVLKDIYDIAIVFSGDQDYVPAVQVVKDFGKRVVNVAFQTRNGRLLPGGARRLNQVTDSSINVAYDTLNDFLKVVT